MTERSLPRTVGTARQECDHCSKPALFRVAMVQFHGESMAELFYCPERAAEVMANEPERVAALVNLAANVALPFAHEIR